MGTKTKTEKGTYGKSRHADMVYEGGCGYHGLDASFRDVDRHGYGRGQEACGEEGVWECAYV